MDYYQESKKIPNVCRFSVCVFEQEIFLSETMYKRVQKQKLKIGILKE